RRDAMQFRNLLLVELPGRDMAVTTMRQFLFDSYHHELLQRLVESASPRVAEIAAKAGKEVAYHVERAAVLVIRVGAGSAESHQRMQDALELLWGYSGEMFVTDSVDESVAAAGVAPRPDALHAAWQQRIEHVLDQATLAVPERNPNVHVGGRLGRHTEHLG